MKFTKIQLVAMILIAVASCKKTESSGTFTDNANCTGVVDSSNTYGMAIKSIIDKNCASSGCHSASSKRDGVDLSSYSAVKSEISTGNSLCTIHHGSGCKPMPQGSAKLSDSDIAKIDCWAKNGYKQ
jgi:hypothetical protein